MSEKVKTLETGTQILPLREAYNARCRCGQTLTWTMSGDDYDDVTATVECECGMAYTALLPTVEIKGTHRIVNSVDRRKSKGTGK